MDENGGWQVPGEVGEAVMKYWTVRRRERCPGSVCWRDLWATIAAAAESADLAETADTLAAVLTVFVGVIAYLVLFRPAPTFF